MVRPLWIELPGSQDDVTAKAMMVGERSVREGAG